MKRAFGILFLTVLVLHLHAQDFWIRRDSVNGNPKTVCVAFTALGKGYIASGLDYNGFTRKMYSYDVVQDDWDNEQSIGGANGGGLSRGSACAFSIGNRGYVCTGQGDNTDFLKDNWEYDPAIDTWTQKADFPGSARRGAVSFVIDAIAYIGTGEDANGLCNDFYKYDPQQNLWGNVAPFAGTARKGAVGFSMGDQGYVGTGFDGIMRKDFWQYLVFQNMWVQKANFPGTPRSGATGWGIFPDGFIATGEDNSFTYMNDVYQYNYFTNSWVQRTSLPSSGRKNAVSFVLDGVAYVGTGYNGDQLDDFYAYYGITGMKEQYEQYAITVYPSPAQDHFAIRVADHDAQNIQVKFFSVDGKDVSSSFYLTRNMDEILAEVRNAAPGIYIAEITPANGTWNGTRKIVIR